METGISREMVFCFMCRFAIDNALKSLLKITMFSVYESHQVD